MKHLPRAAAAALLPLLAALPLGCGGSSTLRIASNTHDAALEPRWSTGVYRQLDSGTAEVYLSDLSMDRLRAMLDGRAPLEPAVVMRISMFIRPKAGRTPIDSTACSATIACIVVSGPALGVYGGGGFILPASAPGVSEFKGSLLDASLRLTSSRGPFEDRLDAAIITGGVRAIRDDEAARALGDQLTALLTLTREPRG